MKKITSSLWLLFFLGCFLSLCSCGFRPRGEIPLPSSLQRLYLQSCDIYGELSRNLKQYLKYSGVCLTDCPQHATAILEILKEDTAQQLLSVGGTQQTRQYNLVLAVTVQVTNPKGCIIIPPRTFVESRIIPIQANQILAGSNEANNLYHQMRVAMVDDIINFLSSNFVAQKMARALSQNRS